MHFTINLHYYFWQKYMFGTSNASWLRVSYQDIVVMRSLKLVINGEIS